MKLWQSIPAFLLFITSQSSQGAEKELKDLSINGGVQEGKARFVIEAQVQGGSSESTKPLYATVLEQAVRITTEQITYQVKANFEILQGNPAELTLMLHGAGEIRKVEGAGLQDWSVRQETNGVRTLVLRPRKLDKPQNPLAVTITAEHPQKSWTNPVSMLTFTPPNPALFSGYIRVETTAELRVKAENVPGLVPMELKFLPEGLKGSTNANEAEPLAFRFQGAPYTLGLAVSAADPEARRVVLRDFSLQGRLSERAADFVLTATARVRSPDGGRIQILSGGAALAEVQRGPDWRLTFTNGAFVLLFEKPGEFPIRLRFNAAVRQSGAWNNLAFRVAPSAVQPVTFEGLAADTQFEFEGAARPERTGEQFRSFLPADGSVRVSWKQAKTETEGKLFYAAEMLSQISISPGLMRQTAWVEARVMQGELNRASFLIRGSGNVTTVQGTNVLSWNVEAVPNSTDRRLVVQFNQAQKEAFALQVQMQSELGAFPQAVDVMQLRLEGATRFAGYFRVVNDGAVRLEVVQSTGLSQISPEQFPESDVTKTLFSKQGGQRFAFRFSSAEFALRVQADNILPELSVSELLAYHFGENELAIDAEFELDIREAPLREVSLRIPKGYALARLTAAGLSDYFQSETPEQPDTELRLVYGQPLSGRQVVQLRLERNAALGQATWELPRIEIAKAKSTRGHLAVSADAGYRLSAERTQGLTEIATAFFPRKVAGIQTAFRLSEATWAAALKVERLPQSIQADGLHIFSIGEGIAYGSSTISYQISGAPVSVFRIGLSDEYFNVEFVGKDVRNWQKTAEGYVVQLHNAVSGAYTLLATCERPFKAQGDTLTFTGARPLDAQNEQGHTLIISAYQFLVKPANVSPGLLMLEPAEVPAEYRLFFDAPILAAYRYNARPFNLQLALSPRTQGETLGLIVDRAVLNTRISKDGEVITDVRYLVKNRGNPHFRLGLPAGTTLWSATVNGATVVPVKDGDANLVPLPQRLDPNAVQTLEFKIASRSATPGRVVAQAPVAGAPVLLAEWNVEPDTAQRLEYRAGTLRPASGVADASGFAALAAMFTGSRAGANVTLLLLAVLLIVFALWAWRWAMGGETYRFAARHSGGMLVGGAALALGFMLVLVLRNSALQQEQILPRGLTFLAPIQQSGSALAVEVSNVPDEWSFARVMGRMWPALLALVVWGYGLLKGGSKTRKVCVVLGWTLVAWGILRLPDGASWFFLVGLAFIALHAVVPAFRALLQVRPKPTAPVTATGATAALIFAAILLGAGSARAASGSNLTKEPVLAESVIQEVRVEDTFVLANAKVRWNAQKGQMLPLLFEPAVLTRIQYPTNALRLVPTVLGSRRTQELLAQESGAFEIELQYQLNVGKRDGQNGFVLPTQHGLVNKLSLTIPDLEVQIDAPMAVSVNYDATSTNRTSATLVLPPAPEPWIGWKPRSRDLKREKAIFYAELFQLYVPMAGVIEGVHQVQIRPAQGEVTSLTFDVPTGATITDVLDPSTIASPMIRATNGTMVSMWRFDPDTGTLRVTLNSPQSRPFTLYVRSQIATGPLPVEQKLGLMQIRDAAGQVGSLGVATGSEVQLDNVAVEAMAPINLEDFPTAPLLSLQSQVAGLTLRRAFHYTEPKATAMLKASAVEPDVRVETQETLSLGEDRTVLAANVGMVVTRAGVFRISFALPSGMDVESISGAALSHWTELKVEQNRVITLHLKGKTEGQQAFEITLAGPGTKPVQGLAVPRLVIREASKQRGQLLVVPEQGMRLQVATREGLTQLDPEKAGIRQKGVLAFRLLQPQWSLGLDVERVDAWVQVTSLQHVVLSEAQAKAVANLQYQIENTGLKSLRVRVPTNAESLRFRGEQVADFLPVPGEVQDGAQTWEVKLHRRVIGKFLLQVNWQTPLGEASSNVVLRGIQALDANLQRGFVTVQSAGRLQLRPAALPATLQTAEWQSIPKALRQDIEGAAADYTFRLVEPVFQLTLGLERHEAAKLLPARVTSVTLASVISDEGVMLTQTKLEMIPGDKALLQVALPADAEFWFAFVNQNGVWPWRDGKTILIPLEQQSRPNAPASVEFFYSSRIGNAGKRKLDLSLVGPKFDLPLENIAWRVYLNEKWKLNDWSGTLQLQEDAKVYNPVAVDMQSYLQNEVSLNREKTKAAEEMLNLGNTLLERGDPRQARRAFQSAYGLSSHDNAFNEDARVQLHNLKVQQALIGLNVRQSGVSGGEGELKLRDLRNRKDAAYTQQEAKQIMDSNSGDENAALMKLAERLIQQQDAAVTSPAAIRASIPEQGRLLTFRRTVQVDTSADLRVRLEASTSHPAPWGVRILTLSALLMVLALFAWMAGKVRSSVSYPAA